MSDENREADAEGAAGASAGLPHPIFNWMSGIGVTLCAIALTAIAFLLLIELVTGGGSGYGGLTLLPPALLGLAGLVLVVAGWLRERRRHRRGLQSSFFETWVVDPWAIVRGRGAWFIPVVIAGATFALLGAGAGSVGVVHYSESNQFCTQACHSVMGPEGAVYEQTAHSRIDCVACHVGAGPEGFFSAKLGGLRQLYHFAIGTVTRPIPTPIHDSPIDRVLCESCHAPERDRDVRASNHDYYLSGEDVYPVHLAMIVKVGGGDSGLVPGDGVHYHMQIARQVEYRARDAKRQEIVWVRSTDAAGETHEYRHDGYGLDDDEIAGLPMHTMQCIDCHSRPAHRFPTAMDSVNKAIEVGVLSRDLPNVKQVGVQALDGDYETTEEALEGIDTAVREFYEDEYPEVLEEQEEQVASAVSTLRGIYQRTIFPEMKASWRAHPDNSGHLDSPGCFRCHNEEMLDEDGEELTTDCSSCHSVLAQNDETIETMEEFEVGRPFIHPEDWSEMEEFTLCSDCHTGGKELYE